MEQIEKDAVEETLEANTEANESNDSDGESSSDAPESAEQTFTDSEYQEYRKLKRLSEKSAKEGGEESHKEVSTSSDVEALTFEVMGVADESVQALARQMVKVGEASNLKEAINSDLVQGKMENANADSTRKNATPPSSNRTPSVRKDTVEHWVDRDGLPENTDLRYKVIEARRAKRGGKQMFGSPRSVIIK